MKRGIVLIGVRQAGELPRLQAVSAGVSAMLTWARKQLIPEDLICVLTDDERQVRAHEVADAIHALIRRDLDQLIVYFSGHGIHNRGERWLLSQAPRNTGEAINVEGSILLARYCGVPHVVLISDACRTAAGGIEALQVTGVDVFPNEPGVDSEQPVDVFFACSRGNPAFEVKVAAESARDFKALYTEVLAECLDGKHVDVLEPDDAAGWSVVRPWPLHDELRKSVPERLEKLLGKLPRQDQVPDARINSRRGWVSRLQQPPPNRVELIGRGGDAHLTAVSILLARTAAGIPQDPWVQLLKQSRIPMTRDLARVGDPFADVPSRTNAIVVVGADVRFALFRNRELRLSGQGARIVEIGASEATGTVFIVLKDGTSVLAPVVAEHATTLFFDKGVLIDLAIEPNALKTDDTLRVRRLRATVAAAVLSDLFPLDIDLVTHIARVVAAEGTFDIVTALHLAYVCHDLGFREPIDTFSKMFESLTGLRSFDLELLGSTRRTAGEEGEWFPSFPLVSRGWSLLDAMRVAVPEPLRQLEPLLAQAPWTQFSREALTLLLPTKVGVPT